MRNRPLSHRLGAAALASTFALATLASARTAAAQGAQTVSPDGSGVVGGALLGAEAVTIVESIANVHSGVAFGVGAAVGAVGGGVGGYFVEHNSSNGQAPVFLLAGGLGLIIPALVLSLNATRYQPSNYASEDHAPTNAPPANPGLPSGSAVSPSPVAAPPPSAPPAYVPPAGAAPAPAPAPAQAPQPTVTPPSGGGAPPLSLFDVSGGAMRLGVPVPEVRPLYSMSELRQYGMAQQTEVRMPLVKIAF
jgi:hypothetical protein